MVESQGFFLFSNSVIVSASKGKGNTGEVAWVLQSSRARARKQEGLQREVGIGAALGVQGGGGAVAGVYGGGAGEGGEAAEGIAEDGPVAAGEVGATDAARE